MVCLFAKEQQIMNSAKIFLSKNQTPLLIFFCSFIFLLFAVIFYIERLYGDSAYYLFQVIDSKKFITQHGRPASVFVQAIPLFLTKLSAPLNTIILFFSINEWLYFFTCIIFLRFITKNWLFSLILIFSLLLGTRWNYFNPVSELILGMPFFLLLIYTFKAEISFPKKISILLMIVIFLTFSHPIYSILIPLMLAFFIVETRAITGQTIGFLILSVLIIFIHYLIIDKYEQNPLKELGDASKAGLKLIVGFNYVRLVRELIPAYLGTFILFGISIVRLFKSSKKSIAAFLIIAVLFYFFMVMFKYGRFFPDTYEPFERYLFPIPLFVCFIFFNFCFRNNTKEIILLSFIACYHFAGIFKYGVFVKERYSIFQTAITNCYQFHEYKFAYRKENYYIQPCGHDWIMSTESVLLSALNGSDKVKQVFIEDFYDPDSLGSGILTESRFIYFPFPMWRKEMDEINTDYFNMHPSALRYVNSDAIQSNYPDTFFQSITIKAGGKTHHKKNRETIIPVSIINDNPVILTSGLRKEEIYISYHWIKNGKVTVWDGLRTPIMCDVSRSIFQFIQIKTPAEKGQYKLRIDLVFEKKKWANVNWKDERIYNID
jgi:hypothetical protein